LSNSIKIASNYIETHNLNKTGKVDNKKIKQEINKRDKGTSRSKQTKQTRMRNNGNGSYQNVKWTVKPRRAKYRVTQE